jgi:hypothetical protein
MNAFGDILSASLTIFLHFLSAFSVTEQVLITYTLGVSVKSTVSKPACVNRRPMDDVSE